MAYVAELYEHISRHSPGIAYRKLLIEHYISVGNSWLEGALDEAENLKGLVPGDEDVEGYLRVLKSEVGGSAAERVAPVRDQDGLGRKDAALKPVEGGWGGGFAEPTGKQEDKRMCLTTACMCVAARAKLLFSTLLGLSKSTPQYPRPPQSDSTNNPAVFHETNPSARSKPRPTQTLQRVARNIRKNPTNATSIAISDMETTILSLKPHSNLDNIRSALISRLQKIKHSLPPTMHIHIDTAFMHVEHERLARNYINDETMLGDAVADIPRAEFFVTEDNYAWSMDELVQAIKANSGVFRNPLSREMFTPEDVQRILAHPLGAPLAALHVEQAALSKGVRVQTIERMEALAEVLLDDHSSGVVRSRTAVDEFLLYVATLPEFEQKALKGLKCPAKDSHTGQAYDCSVGKAVNDARANLVCFHKTGDFIGQAAGYLRRR
ncbi:hypothetical protein A1F96_05680 [Pyrenophora tritici-repentis]|nr:hypothetical protein Ptr86124_003732 [Pyrenophora tritici-repentis]KAI1670622.1 hypothetical protein L13192_06138 [Pyrenophora tritici-repentis]KAI1682261.1 hypothetical protein KJE20_09132 [Pyrenophora tritici-repentis]PZD28733.1 hypothetical protein A1F96_05680 [Pyrenophora tritici-repentis]